MPKLAELFGAASGTSGNMAQISAINCTISADAAAQSIDNAQIPEPLKGIRPRVLTRRRMFLKGLKGSCP